LSTNQGILAYIKQTDRGDDVYFYLLEQESHLRITDSGGIKACLSFSPDGTRLLYVQKPLNSTDAYYDIYSIGLNRFWTAGELMQYLDSINVNDYE
jgi:Tol biopolymer transport system component